MKPSRFTPRNFTSRLSKIPTSPNRINAGWWSHRPTQQGRHCSLRKRPRQSRNPLSGIKQAAGYFSSSTPTISGATITRWSRRESSSSASRKNNRMGWSLCSRICMEICGTCCRSMRRIRCLDGDVRVLQLIEELTPFPSFPQIKIGFGGRGTDIANANNKNLRTCAYPSPISVL